MQGTWVQSLGWEDPLEEEMATHSSILARRIPWTEAPGGLQSIGLQRVRRDWRTNTFTICGEILYDAWHGQNTHTHTHTHTHVYSLIVLEARCLKSVPLGQHQDGGSPTCTPEALEESSFLVSSSFCGRQHFLACGHITTISTSIFTPLYVCVCVCIWNLPLPALLIRIDMIAFRAHLDNLG